MQADVCRYSSFIEANGQALLDLSLYVSSKNYYTVVRGLYSAILPWPLQYTIPPKLRSAAKARTAHLGLSSLDMDAAEPSTDTKSHPAIPQSLATTPTATVTSILTQPHHSAQFRLSSLAAAFFTPLHALRTKTSTRYLLGPHPTTLDCLALAYLSLALLPDLPSPFLAS